MRFIDLTGQQFGHLTVESFIERRGKHSWWKCRCVCGEFKAVTLGHLKSGDTRSCGCKRNKMISETLKTHGGSSTREFRIWSLMKTRCHNPKANRYPRYGGRGITVCDRWKDSFQNFYDDMGPCPIGMSIDRENNDLGYFKENCKWSTATEQALNRSTKRLIEFGGRTMHISQWESEMGFNRGIITRRLAVGWSIEKAIMTPVQNKIIAHGRVF